MFLLQIKKRLESGSGVCRIKSAVPVIVRWIDSRRTCGTTLWVGFAQNDREALEFRVRRDQGEALIHIGEFAGNAHRDAAVREPRPPLSVEGDEVQRDSRSSRHALVIFDVIEKSL